MGIVLRGPGIYVPPTVLTNKDLVELVDEQGQRVIDTDEDWIVSMTGMNERRIAIDEDVKKLGIKAALDLQRILGHSLRPDEIIFATNRHRDKEFPCYAAAVAETLGCNPAIYDLGAGCTGLVYAIRNAFNDIKSGEIHSALVIGAERLSDFSNYRDRKTCVLFGDGASAFYLEQNSESEGIIANFVSGRPDREGYLTLMPPEMGMKLSRKGDKFIATNASDQFLHMNGNRVYRFAQVAMSEAVHEVLKRSLNPLTREPYTLRDIDVIVPHGANIRIIQESEEELRNGEKGFRGVVFTNLKSYGNTSTASVGIAARDARDTGIIKPGSLVCHVAFGAGLTYGANLYRASA